MVDFFKSKANKKIYKIIFSVKTINVSVTLNVWNSPWIADGETKTWMFNPVPQHETWRKTWPPYVSGITPVIMNAHLTSEPQLGLGASQCLLNVLGLGDVHLDEGEARRANTPQLLGTFSAQIQHAGEHLEPQRVQLLSSWLPETGVTTLQKTKSVC